MSPAQNQRPERPLLPDRVLITIVTVILVAAMALEAHGFRTAPLFGQDIWVPLGVRRFLKYCGMYVGLAAPLLLMAPWSFAGVITGLTAVGTAFAIGPIALIATAFFLISSCALGSRLFAREHGDEAEPQLLSTLAGAAIWIVVMTLTARWPIHYSAVWAPLLALPILVDLRGTKRRLTKMWQLVSGAELRSYAERAAFAAIVFVLLAHWFVALKPEISADGLAMHLAIPANIAANHRQTFEPGRFVWAVMPMAADYAYSIVYILGGEYAAHLLDYSMLLILAGLLYFAMRRWVGRAVAFLLLALFLSTPMVQLVTGSLFVENVLAAFLVGMLVALWRFSESGERRYLYICAVLGGSALEVKFGALAFVALTLPFAVIEIVRRAKLAKPRGFRPFATAILAAALLIGFAAPPYLIAYVKTGDPLFPFLGERFHPPIVPPDYPIIDSRFQRPLSWETLYELTFRTTFFYEGRNGSFGFQNFLLVPLAIAAAFAARRGRTSIATGLAVVAVGAAIIIMATQPNARYIYPALPLLSIPFAIILNRVASTRWLYGALLAFAAGCLAMNIRFMPSGGYYHRDFSLRLPFSRAEHERYLLSSPIRAVIDYFDRNHAGATVLMTNDSSIAGLNANIYENHWHQIWNFKQIRETLRMADMLQLLQSWGVQYFISPKPSPRVQVKPVALEELLDRCTDKEFESGDQVLAHLLPVCRPPVERKAILVHPGFYDDFEPALLFRGDWTKDTNFDGPDQHTITYTADPEGQVEILFEGKALTYTYTKASNRGIASVIVDGKELGKVDLYSPTIEWQSRTRFCCFKEGRHVALVRVTGSRNPKSSWIYIDLDSFVVE